ncbi:hypothetical protein ACFQZC_16040 [Streptacidiphilus monticola]
MSHPIAKALEEAAARVGRTLSKDAAKAVSDMYHSAGHGTAQVVKNITEADARHAHELVSLAEKIAKNDGKTGRGSRRRIRQQADARSKIDAALGGRRDYDVELVVDSRKYPESAQHIHEAQSGVSFSGPPPAACPAPRTPRSSPSTAAGLTPAGPTPCGESPPPRRWTATSTRPRCSRRAEPEQASSTFRRATTGVPGPPWGARCTASPTAHE